MTIQKKSLLNSLKLAMPGIETGNVVLQGADTFIFHNGNIFSYNDLISVCVPLHLDELVDEGVEGAVHADEFYKVISKFNGDEINFAVTENKTWILKCGKAKAEIALMDFDFESRLNDITPSEEWIEIDDSLITGIGSCKMANNKSALAGIFISGKYICSADGYQINRFETKFDLPTMWLSDNSANELIKLKNFKFLQLQDSWVHFKTEDGTIFSLKTMMSDKFPFDRVNMILDNSSPKDDDIHAVFPAELFNAIDRACAFSIDINGHISVRLNITHEFIEVSSERATGKYSEKVAWDDNSKIENEFEPITVYVDSVMMEFMAKRTLEFYLIKDAKNGKVIPRLLFVSPESKHLISTFSMN